MFFKKTPTNQEIARVMDDIAGLLEISTPIRSRSRLTGRAQNMYENGHSRLPNW